MIDEAWGTETRAALPIWRHRSISSDERCSWIWLTQAVTGDRGASTFLVFDVCIVALATPRSARFLENQLMICSFD